MYDLGSLKFWNPFAVLIGRNNVTRFFSFSGISFLFFTIDQLQILDFSSRGLTSTLAFTHNVAFSSVHTRYSLWQFNSS
jgi:hypothetical protein